MLYLSNKKMFVFYFVIFIWWTFFLCAQTVLSVPQFAVLNNEKCISCHINAQGGGLRNFRGWRSYSDVSLIKPEKVKLDRVYKYDGKSNTLLNRKLTLGTDFRLQMARSHKSPDSKRRVFPMQAAVYADYKITNWIHTEVSYNFGPKKFEGQQSWTASAIIQPEFSYTQFRLGYFQPSIGIRYDDHIMLVRQVPGADGSTYIAPNYTEYGAEFNYNGFEQLTLTAGLYDTKSLAENFVIDNNGKQVSLIDNRDTPSVLGRIVYWPEAFNENINLFSGGSYFIHDDFSISSFFTGIGFANTISVMTDYTRTVKTDMRTTNNLMVELTYRVITPLQITVRGERGKTFANIGGQDIKTYTNQALIGTQIFMLPYIELRPEYRIVDTERFRSTRYAIQLHIFR